MTQAPESEPLQTEAPPEEPPPAEPSVVIPQAVVVKDLGELLSVSAVDIIKELMKNGVMATINQVIDFDTAAVVATDFGFIAEEERAAVEAAPADADAEPVTFSMRVEEEDDGSLQTRPPIVTVLGHVDHGKTTLLDGIRHANVVDGEAGGITQHIGAYQATAPDGRLVTFIDTPGHEAFTEMRARGAQVTDVAVIVVAADDGVMPQTREAIDHARAAGVPIVIALNKIDVPNANPDRAKQQLMEMQLVPEEYGGDVVVVPVSALKREGIDELLENVLLVSDLEEPKANPDRDAVGVVLEARTDRNRGVVATVLVQTGTLKQGDAVIAGMAYGRIKSIENQDGERIKSAGPSTPVAALGLSEVPPAGARLTVMPNEKAARREAEQRRRALEAVGEERVGLTLDTLFGEIHKGTIKDFNILLKTDVQGSVEPLVRALENLTIDDEVNVKVIHAAAGSINESDVNLAVASQGVIIGFNTRPEAGAKRLAASEHIEIREYSVIYDIIEDVEQAVQGLLEPIYEEREDGRIEVRAVFRLSRRNAIAGAYVTAGTVKRDSLIRVMRNGEKMHESKITSLKRFENDVADVASGFECGIMIDGFVAFEEGDELVAFHMERTR
jgi:translation initiation factor IF-2